MSRNVLDKKCVGRGLFERGSTYLKRERLGLGLGFGLESLLYPSRLGLGWGLYLWRRVVPWPCGKVNSRGRMRVVES